MCEELPIGSLNTVSEWVSGMWSAGKAFWVSGKQGRLLSQPLDIRKAVPRIYCNIYTIDTEEGQNRETAVQCIGLIIIAWLFVFINQKGHFRQTEGRNVTFVVYLLSILAIHVKKKHDIQGICGEKTETGAYIGLQAPDKPEIMLGELEQELLKWREKLHFTENWNGHCEVWFSMLHCLSSPDLIYCSYWL